VGRLAELGQHQPQGLLIQVAVSQGMPEAEVRQIIDSALRKEAGHGSD
jgi:hypothetical protein